MAAIASQRAPGFGRTEISNIVCASTIYQTNVVVNYDHVFCYGGNLISPHQRASCASHDALLTRERLSLILEVRRAGVIKFMCGFSRSSS